MAFVEAAKLTISVVMILWAIAGCSAQQPGRQNRSAAEVAVNPATLPAPSGGAPLAARGSLANPIDRTEKVRRE